MINSDRISIILPTKNKPNHLSKFLDTLYKNEGHGIFDILLINDGDHSQIDDLISRYPSLRIVHYKFSSPINNLSKMVNFGVVESMNFEGNLAAYFHDDVFFYNDAFSEFDQTVFKEKSVGFFNVFNISDEIHDNPRFWIMNKKDFISSGGFDSESFTHNFCQEEDYFSKLHYKGFNIFKIENFFVGHKIYITDKTIVPEPHSFHLNSPDSYNVIARNRFNFMKKWKANLNYNSILHKLPSFEPKFYRICLKVKDDQYNSVDYDNIKLIDHYIDKIEFENEFSSIAYKNMMTSDKRFNSGVFSELYCPIVIEYEKNNFEKILEKIWSIDLIVNKPQLSENSGIKIDFENLAPYTFDHISKDFTESSYRELMDNLL